MNGSPLISTRLLAGVGGAVLLAALTACATGPKDVAFSDTYSIDTERMVARGDVEAPMDYDTLDSPDLAPATVVGMVDKYGNAIVTSKGRLHGVVTGDTLWDISDSYLADNFLWPKVWDYNGEIMNPDLIYPGDRIRIPVALLPPEIQELIPVDVEAIEVAPVPEDGFESAEVPPLVDIVEEEIKVEDTAKVDFQQLVGMEEFEIPEEFRAEIATELEVERPDEPVKVVEWTVPRGAINPTLVEAAGYITRSLRAKGRLVGTYEPRFIMGRNDEVFLKMNWFKSSQVGDKFYIVRVERPVYHPLTDDAVGKLVRVLGVVTVQEQENNGLFLAKVNRSFETVLSGDLLVPYEKPEVDVHVDPPGGLTGMIIDAKDAASLLGRGHIVYIDLGKRDGLKPGNQFEILQRGRKVRVPGLFANPRLPTRKIGVLQVISVQDRTASARVMRAIMPVEIGDRLQSVAPEAAVSDEAVPVSVEDAG
ncbi:MAG: LysM peptidoglycan-binding domain-containing protein [Nitrospirota bacterium]|nr:LysM peptidoglycan-binding domain-containing protein [Nitrospirota bacterium]